MKTSVDCVTCIINQGIKIAKSMDLAPETTQSMLHEILSNLSKKDLFNTNPPFLAKDIYQIIYKHINNFDPYKDIKDYYNKEIMSMENELQKIIDNSENKFLTAVKLAIVGNIIDFGTGQKITVESVRQNIKDSIHTELKINSTEILYSELKKAKKLLYLGDNCGEIVFDKLLIKFIKKEFPNLDITFAVRGAPVINDVTIKDAIQVGIDNLVRVINNGDNAPGTILSDISEEFRNEFDSADVVISKGQGNYETLNDCNHKNIFFLFMSKCPIVSSGLGVEMFSFICSEGAVELV